MNRYQLQNLLSFVTFRDWRFRSGPLGDGCFIQVEFDCADTDSGEPATMRGRKWYISPFAIADEVYKTCWIAVELALRHEAMEEFKVGGVAPFHPHTNIEYLLETQDLAGVHVHRPDPETNPVHVSEGK